MVGTSINKSTRTSTIHGHLNDYEEQYFAKGKFVDAEIELSSSQSIAAPESGIIKKDEETVILVLKSFNKEIYSFEDVHITIGKKHIGFAETLSTDPK